MLRLILVSLALISMAQAGFVEGDFPMNPVEQASWGFPNANTLQLSEDPVVDEDTFFYFCHSYCTFNGKYQFQRFWLEEDPNFIAETDIFDWSADGGTDFWADDVDGDCDDVINYFRYYPESSSTVILQFSSDRLKACRPVWIYIENVEVQYKRDKGKLFWRHFIEKAFQPTVASWNEWADLAVNAKRGNTDGMDTQYDQFDGLFRVYPDADDSKLTDQFKNDYFYEETYVSNYEPNYCTMQMSQKAVDKRMWCYGEIIDDTDATVFDSGDFPTREYCQARGSWIQEEDYYEFGCGIGDSDDCDSVRFYENTNLDPVVTRNALGKPSKTERLRQATASPAKLAIFEKRGPSARDQPVSYFSPSNLFYYQNYAAGLRFPFCASKHNN